MIDKGKTPYIKIEWDAIDDSKPNLDIFECDAMMLYAALATIEQMPYKSAPCVDAMVSINFARPASVTCHLSSYNVTEAMKAGIVAFLRIEAERMIAQQIMQHEADTARAYHEQFEKKPPILLPDGSAVSSVFDGRVQD